MVLIIIFYHLLLNQDGQVEVTIKSFVWKVKANSKMNHAVK